MRSLTLNNEIFYQLGMLYISHSKPKPIFMQFSTHNKLIEMHLRFIEDPEGLKTFVIL